MLAGGDGRDDQGSIIQVIVDNSMLLHRDILSPTFFPTGFVYALGIISLKGSRTMSPRSLFLEALIRNA